MKTLAVLSVFLATVYGTGTGINRVQSEVVRNDDECPPQAVCADVFDYNQIDENTGISVPKTRRVINCMCANRGGCPNTKRHTLYATSRHRQQICQPRNTLSRCKKRQIAEQMHVNSDLFGGQTYYKMKCWCRRHKRPVPNGGFRERATQLLGQTFEDEHWVHNYVCARRRRRPRLGRTAA